MSADATLLSACTRDEILRGRLRLWQPRQGYRFSVDALLVAHFAWSGLARSLRSVAPRAGEPARAADLGAGCGVVGLALAAQLPGLTVDLVELQARLGRLARINAADNDLCDRVTAHQADLRDLRGTLPGDRYALAVSNPPFAPAGQGRPSPEPERAAATTELTVTLPELVQAAARLLSPDGTFAVIYPAERLPALLAACTACGLGPASLRAVHPLPDRPASRILLSARKGSRRPLQVLPPLVMHARPGRYTEEAEAILAGTWDSG